MAGDNNQETWMQPELLQENKISNIQKKICIPVDLIVNFVNLTEEFAFRYMQVPFTCYLVSSWLELLNYFNALFISKPDFIVLPEDQLFHKNIRIEGL